MEPEWQDQDNQDRDCEEMGSGGGTGKKREDQGGRDGNDESKNESSTKLQKNKLIKLKFSEAKQDRPRKKRLRGAEQREKHSSHRGRRRTPKRYGSIKDKTNPGPGGATRTNE